jgi:hypothetical protein
MIRRILVFGLGAIVGYLIDLAPFLIGSLLRLAPCVESCPPWFKISSISVYLGMPVGWGVLFVFAFGKTRTSVSTRTLLLAFGASVLLLSIVASFAYGWQAQLL